MPDAEAGGWHIRYEVVGPGDGETVILIPGLGEQIGSVEFPDEHCAIMAEAGLRVVRTENRDNGYSLPNHDPGDPDWTQILTALADGSGPRVPYAVADQADDVIAVMDHLGLERAILLGASLGSAIARWTAIRHPDRVRCLMLVMGMSGAGASESGPQFPEEALNRLFPLSFPHERAEAVELVVDMWRWAWGGTYPFEEPWVRERAEFAFDRSYRPSGVARNLAAAIPIGLWDSQRNITCPTLVMHGGEDPCCPLDHGHAIADRIPHSEMWEVPGMGHCMHRELWPEMTDRLKALISEGPS